MTYFVDKLSGAVRNVDAAPEEDTLTHATGRPYKRSDIPTAVVLSCVHTLGFTAFDVLCQTFPGKVVLAAFMRDEDRGLTECGSSTARPWLTPAGKQWLIHHSDAARRGRKMNGQSELREKPCTLTNSTRPRDAQ